MMSVTSAMTASEIIPPPFPITTTINVVRIKRTRIATAAHRSSLKCAESAPTNARPGNPNAKPIPTITSTVRKAWISESIVMKFLASRASASVEKRMNNPIAAKMWKAVEMIRFAVLGSLSPSAFAT